MFTKRDPSANGIKHGKPTEWTLYDAEYGEVLLRFGETKDTNFVYQIATLIATDNTTVEVPMALAKNNNLFFKATGEYVFTKIQIEDADGALFMELLEEDRKKLEDQKLSESIQKKGLTNKFKSTKKTTPISDDQTCDISTDDIPF